MLSHEENEPTESDFRTKVKALAYPCTERGGVVWTYMGSRTNPPPLPSIEANLLPEQDSQVRVVLRECNWLQALEGDIDTSALRGSHPRAAQSVLRPPGGEPSHRRLHSRGLSPATTESR
jgi:phenylpropionate dioxygenase-like ring-hydroxylating dioxygenase large terminal subunit